MFSTLFTITILSAAAIRGALASLAINSPELVQCEDAHISWAQTQGPYNLIVTPGDDPCGPEIADLGDHTGTTMTYTVALPAGSKVLLSLQDATGEEAWSQELTVQAGSDSSCLPASLRPSVSVSTSASASATVSSTFVPLTAVTPATTLSAFALASSNVPAAAAASAAPSDADADTATVAPVGGAANAAANPFSSNGAFSIRQLYTPAMLLSALGAAVLVAL